MALLLLQMALEGIGGKFCTTLCKHLPLIPKTSILVSQLPKQTWFDEHYELCQWEGSWYLPPVLEGALATQSHFEACDDDNIIIASSLKVGTTWLKSLVPSIINCPQGDDDEDDPLVENNPHGVVLTLELQVFPEKQDITTLPSPRIFHTHLPYNSLQDSIKNSNCKIVYMPRNPMDVFVSLISMAFYEQTSYTRQWSFSYRKSI
ncbi:Cytosolic sulfotransferase [Thalictrum thalictroides]|uniref:Sulfotransferase n=1 Tax=Thalictrum thalictroides TaxID=46969 RepID=A0A7J6V729_THATH|nr:Cytosolic sulfotransferase [Thalictrum thalictroides]